MSGRTKWVVSAALLLGAVASAAHAGAPSAPGARSGGVGLEKRAEMERARGDFNVRLAFTDSRGRDLSDVAVRISKVGGAKVFEGRDQGPWLFLRLAPGRYRLEVVHDGIAQERRLNVADRQAAPLMVMQWPGGRGA